MVCVPGPQARAHTWQNYTDVNRAYHDATEALSYYPSLSVRTDVYSTSPTAQDGRCSAPQLTRAAYENGSPNLLLNLSGTLPVTFRGATYGFPVAVWVPYAYPREAPIVYIKPDHDMLVRPGQYVSGDGRVYHPYLAQWAEYWDKSTLFDLLAVLRDVFAKEPPVRSRQHNLAPPPVPLPPVEYRRPAQPSQRPIASPAPPPEPPKPPKPHEQNGRPQTDRYSQPPPLPPHPPQQHTRQQHLQQPPQQHYPQPLSYSHGLPPNWQQQAPPAGQLPPQQPPAQHHRSQQAPPHPLGQPSPQQQQYHAPSHHYPPTRHQHYQQLQQQAPLAPKPAPPVNLLDDSLQVTLPSQQASRASHPVPPVPPNPQKDALLTALSQALVSQTRQLVASNQAAVAPLRAQQQALQTAHATLQAELGELQHLDATLASNEQMLKGAMVDADRAMDDAQRRQAPDVDDVLVAPTVVGQQLYTLAAEERGIADALFVLGRALDKGRITADVFVKVCAIALPNPCALLTNSSKHAA